MNLLHVPAGLAPGAGHWIAGPMNHEAVDDALTPRAAVGEYRVPAEDRILRPGTGENKLLAVNGNHRVLKGKGGLSRRLFPVTGELLQALEHRHEGQVLFARLDQPLHNGRLLRQNLVDEIWRRESTRRCISLAPVFFESPVHPRRVLKFQRYRKR